MVLPEIKILVLAMKKARKHVVSPLIERVCIHPRISSQMANIGQVHVFFQPTHTQENIAFH